MASSSGAAAAGAASDIDEVIAKLLEVRGSRPGKQVNLTETDIRGLCTGARVVFMNQPVLLELEAPIKICGQPHSPRVRLPPRRRVVAAWGVRVPARSTRHASTLSTLDPRALCLAGTLPTPKLADVVEARATPQEAHEAVMRPQDMRTMYGLNEQQGLSQALLHRSPQLRAGDRQFSTGASDPCLCLGLFGSP